MSTTYVSSKANVFTDDFLTSALSLPARQSNNSSGRFSSFNPFTYNRQRSKEHSSSSLTPPVTPSPSRKEAAPIKFQTLKEIGAYLRQRSDEDPFMPSDVSRYCAKIVELMEEAGEDNVKEQKRGAKALFLLSQLDISDVEGPSSTEAGVACILTAMENLPDDERLQEVACLALQALTAWEENQAFVLAGQGLIDIVCTAMETHNENDDLQISALGVLCNISSSPDAVESDNAKELSYVIPTILELLKENRDHVDIYQKGCSTLAKLTEDNPSSQLLFCNDNQLGIRMAIDALHNATFSDEYQIQHAAMIILQNVASNSSLECKGRIIIHGGLDRILETLQRHSVIAGQIPGKTTLSSHIMASGLQTLANLSDSNIREHDKTRQKMGVAVPVMLKVLKKHPKMAQVQTSGHSALKNLADIHADLIIRHEGISIIMKNMAEQINNPAVQKTTCRTLVKLFSKEEKDASWHNNLLSSGNNPSERTAMDLVMAIAEEDGIDIIFRSVRLHQKHRLVQEAAFEALYHLSCSRQLSSRQKRQLCLEENVFVLMGTIRTFIESETICEFGSGLLLNMSFFAPLQQETMASVGGIKLVLHLMRRHGLNKKTQEHAAGILSGLCQDPATHEEFVSEEGISTIVSAMTVHPYQPGIQAFGCDVLASIAGSSAEYKQQVVDDNARELAKEAMDNHQRHNGVQNRGSVLLKTTA
ncbi:MAG: hypothetical protein SGILL_004808 [Bacillariaceae sp.]